MSGNQQNCGRYPGGEEKQTENRRQPVVTWMDRFFFI
jgi:hypothetical protein